MAISSSSGSNSIDYPSSPSSSNLSASSLDSIPESREPTPEYDPAAAYEALAPLHWDAEEFDFGIASEDDEPQTEGEDLQLLFQEELESSSEEGSSWDGGDSSSEAEIGSSSSDDDPMGGNPFPIPRVLRGGQRGRKQRRPEQRHQDRRRQQRL